MKLIVDEPESDALERWLRQRATEPVASSEVARVEVLLSCRRRRPALTRVGQELLRSVDVVELTAAVLETAAHGPADLGTLDALHLATAVLVRHEVTAFLTYDRALGDAAQGAGFTVATPR